MTTPDEKLSLFLRDLRDDAAFEKDAPLIEMDLRGVEAALLETNFEAEVAVATIDAGREVRVERPVWGLGRVVAGLAATVLLCIGGSLAAVYVFLLLLDVGPAPTTGESGEWLIARGLDASASVAPEEIGFPESWRRAALTVGVTNYRDDSIRGLRTATMEAERAGKIAVTHFRAPRENVIHLAEEAATEAAVRSALIYLSQFSSPKDLILIHFACHALLDGENELRFQFYDSPRDNGILGSEVLELLGGTAAKVVLVADVCNSGQIVSTWESNGNIWVVASSGPEENAFEVPFEEESGFGSLWHKALSGEADANEDGLVTITEAFDWTSDEMSERRPEQHPMYFAPNGEDDLVLSVHPDLRATLPPRGDPIGAPSPLRLALNSAEDVTVTLDGQDLGTLRGPVAVLPVGPGEHQVRVRYAPEWIGDPGEQQEWHADFVARPGESNNQDVLLKPQTLGELPVLPLDGSGFFKKLVRSPATDAVSVSALSDSIHRFEFRWLAAIGVPQRLASAVYLADENGGENVQAKLGLDDTARVALSFYVKGTKGGERVTLFMGGVGADSLLVRRATTLSLSGSAWKRVSIEVDAKQLRHLVCGFGIEVDRKENPGDSTSILVRDMKLAPVIAP